jgi:hypothetical protein
MQRKAGAAVPAQPTKPTAAAPPAAPPPATPQGQAAAVRS